MVQRLVKHLQQGIYTAFKVPVLLIQVLDIVYRTHRLAADGYLPTVCFSCLSLRIPVEPHNRYQGKKYGRVYDIFFLVRIHRLKMSYSPAENVILA
jgi:hypothetical protein